MKVFCILSDERAFRSKSPAMHTAVLKHLEIDGVYVPFRVEPRQLGEAIAGIRALNIAGANVTVPYKESVIPCLDRISDEASEIGAVNTIVPDEGKLIGHNTDAEGLLDAIREAGMDVAGKSALVFGAGGAARAVVAALRRAGAEQVLVTGRNDEKVEHTALQLKATPTPMQPLADMPVSADLVVNATPVSSVSESPEMADFLAHLHVLGCNLVVDLNYGRDRNFWRDFAVSHEADFMDGLPMLAHQARRSFELWTGMSVDPRLFVDALREAS
jgi:shikimate dehydrogenase